MTYFTLASDDTYALAADGVVVHLRDLGPADLAAIVELHACASERSYYLRFFGGRSAAAQDYFVRLAQSPSNTHRAIGAFGHDRLLGVGAFERLDDQTAEFALLVADSNQHHGLGTLVLEHLIAGARALGIRRFTGTVLAENAAMIDVVRRLGFPLTTSAEGPEIEVDIAIDAVDPAAAAIEDRERLADTRSLHPLLAPQSIVVVGAGQQPGSVGHEILRNIRAARFAGPLFAVNPHRSEVLGVRCVASAADLPIAPDLAVIAVPAVQVPQVLRQCGERGCRAAVVVGSGFAEAGADGVRLQDDALAAARNHSMRLLGPNCIGLLNTDPSVRLNATFAASTMSPGKVSVISQSGAFGVGLLAAADAVGLGISQFVSVGNKADVGGNDLLLAWAEDPGTQVIAMYLESVGDPRRFARIAREVARHKPILAIKSGRTAAGRRAGQSHTAAAASPDAAVDALLRGSGVLRMRTTSDLLDAARVLAGQPLPAGPRVAIVGNSGGPQILAADSVADNGLVMAEFDSHTRDALRAAGVSEQNPLDLGAAARPELVAAVLQLVHACPQVDAVLTVFTDISVIDAPAIRAAVLAAAGPSDKPTVAVEVGAAQTMLPIPDTTRSVPVFSFAESAAAALGAAHRYAGLRAEPPAPPVRPTGLDESAARDLVTAVLAEGRGWLASHEIAALLDAYGIRRSPQRVVSSADEAVTAAAALGYPVVAKLAGAGLHKSDVGGVRLCLADGDAVRSAVTDLLALDTDPAAGLLIQPMAAPGVELIAGGLHDNQFGPLVMLGAGGILTEVLGDRVLRLAPVSDAEADRMISDLRSARLLDGYRGTPPVSRAAVRDVVVRLATLLDDLPMIAEVDLNPLICGGDAVLAVDARVRVASPPYHPDPLVRQLRPSLGPPPTPRAERISKPEPPRQGLAEPT